MSDSPKIFNLDAVENEAKSAPFRFQFAKKSWTMQHQLELDVWPMLEAGERGDNAAMVAVFQAALGDKFDEFRQHRLSVNKMTALFEAYQEHCGLAVGESEASSSS